VGVVAIHDDEHVVICAIGSRIFDQCAQARTRPLVDNAVENDQRQALLPCVRGGERRIGTAVVIKDKGHRLG